LPNPAIVARLRQRSFSHQGILPAAQAPRRRLPYCGIVLLWKSSGSPPVLEGFKRVHNTTDFENPLDYVSAHLLEAKDRAVLRHSKALGADSASHPLLMMQVP